MVIETFEMNLKYKKSGEVVDVCKAIQEMQMKAEQKGELKKARESAKKLYEMGLEMEKIAQVADYPVEKVEEWLGLA